MPDYAYKAADATGKIISDTRFANSEQELTAGIRAAGLHLVEFKEARTLTFIKYLQEFQVGGISRRDLIEFSNNMGVMFRAGVPLINALDEIRQDMENKAFKKVLGQVIMDIEAGDALHEAMANRPKQFPALYVNVIQIGESTGSLDTVFFDLARHYKRIDDLVRNVRKAMAYPIFVLIALLLASFVFLVMVFPPLFELLETFDVELPLITKIVMGVSTFLKDNWLLLLFAVILLIAGFIIARRYPKSKYYIDWTELNIPGLKTVFVQLRISFFMRYLSMVLSAGMDILRGLELAIDSVNNLVIQKMLRQAREHVIEGDLLSQALRRVRYIPNMVTRMVAIGEESGNMAEQMEYVADYYNEELERKISMALALLEPILLFCLAGLALSLVMGVLLPIYNLVSALSQQAGSGGGMM